MTNFPMPASHLRQEYEQHKTLFENQPPIVQRFIEGQARQIAEALVSKTLQARFTLPDRVMLHVKQVGQEAVVTLPEAQREQRVGNLATSLSRQGVREALVHRLQALEQSPDQAISASASVSPPIEQPRSASNP